MKTITKLEAIKLIITDARREHANQASFKRMVRSVKTLGFEGQELIEVLSHLDYVDDKGKPWRWIGHDSIP